MDNQQNIAPQTQTQTDQNLNQPKQPQNKKKIIVVSLIAILILAAFGGLYYWQNSKNKNLQKQLDATKAQLEKQQTKTEVNDIPTTKAPVDPNYAGWAQVTNETLNPNQIALYKNGTATLSVYSKEPMMNLSSNAPGYCTLQNEAWTPSDRCNSSITESTVNGMNAYTAYGGALGRTKYLVVVQSNNQWFVFSDYLDYDPDPTKDSNVEINQDKAQLASSMEKLVAKVLPQN